MIVCQDCGCRVYDGFCTCCDEEHFIAEQYLMDGESVPIVINDLDIEQTVRRDDRQRAGKP